MTAVINIFENLSRSHLQSQTMHLTNDIHYYKYLKSLPCLVLPGQPAFFATKNMILNFTVTNLYGLLYAKRIHFPCLG